MANKKAMVGRYDGNMPVHEGFIAGDTVVDPLGNAIVTLNFTTDFNARNIASYIGTPSVSSVVYAYVFAEDMNLTDGAGSKAVCKVAPSAQTDFSLTKIDGIGATEIGIVRFAAGGTIASFQNIVATSFVAGNRLEMQSPSSVNGLTGLTVNFVFRALGIVNPNVIIPI